MELIQQIIENLGVSEEQANGGAGLIFQFLKDKLSGDDFGQIANMVPGLDSMIEAAPNLEQASSSGGVAGLLGGIASALGAGKLSDLANLSEGFSQLGLSSDMIGQFAPTIISFIEQQGGDNLVDMIKKVLN